MAEVRPAEWTRWGEVQRARPGLESPYFRPEFTRAVAAARDDVRVGVVETAGGAAAFFPFHRGRLGLGRPVGGCLSDYHGVIAPEDLDLDLSALLRASGLLAWSFDHLPADQRAFDPAVRARSVSPAVDVSAGFARYRSERRAEGSRRLAQLDRKARKLAREVGPLRFEADARDPALLRRVVRWKSEQCRRTGVLDFFGRAPWTRRVVERIAATRGPHFQGLLSALWAGEHLVAAHFGMRSDRVLHWWFPGYDPTFARYSPGALLLLRVIEAAAERGLRRVDLGKGDDPYKVRFANDATPLAEGLASPVPALPALRDAGCATARWLRASPLRPAARAVRRWARRTPL